mgnify:CR=1 FL=1
MTNDTLQNKGRLVRLLIVEDNRGDALLVKRAFGRLTIKNNITIATTGEEALRLLNNEIKKNKVKKPDIIILDLNLPGMHGLEVLKTIKNDAQLKRIPVIILSSSCAEYDVIHCYDNYANCYMKKAANLEELYELIDKIEEFWFKHVILSDEDKEGHTKHPL